MVECGGVVMAIDYVIKGMPALEKEVSCLRQRVDSGKPEHLGDIVDDALCLYSLVLKDDYYNVYCNQGDDNGIDPYLLQDKESILGFVRSLNSLVHSISGSIKDELRVLSDCVPDSDSLELRKRISDCCSMYNSLVSGVNPGTGDGLSFPEHKDVGMLSSFNKEITRIHAEYNSVENSYLDSALDRDSVSLAEKRLWSLSRALGSISCAGKSGNFKGAYDASILIKNVNSLSFEMRSLLEGRLGHVSELAGMIDSRSAECASLVSRLDSMDVSASLDCIRSLSSLAVPDDIKDAGGFRYLRGRVDSYRRIRSGCIARLDVARQKAKSLLEDEFSRYAGILSEDLCGKGADARFDDFIGLEYRYSLLFEIPDPWRAVESLLAGCQGAIGSYGQREYSEVKGGLNQN
jgi:hypothetical protein